MAEWHEATLLDLVVLPMIPYLIWALLYYVKVCLILVGMLVLEPNQARVQTYM